jgi:phage host-nuclease inhibitor protein Gam
MAVLIPRIRTISVRLSNDEFAALERQCATSGARSISDFARDAICNVLRQGTEQRSLISSITEYSARVKQLEQEVERLAAQVALFKPQGQTSNVSHSVNESAESPNGESDTAGA